MIRSILYPSRNAHSDEIKQMLGLLSDEKLPAAGLPARMIQGYEVWVEPLYKPYRGARRASHRVRARCVCGQVMSAGRTHQHKCKETTR